jgi:hypothetical protein
MVCNQVATPIITIASTRSDVFADVNIFSSCRDRIAIACCSATRTSFIRKPRGPPLSLSLSLSLSLALTLSAVLLSRLRWNRRAWTPCARESTITPDCAISHHQEISQLRDLSEFPEIPRNESITREPHVPEFSPPRHHVRDIPKRKYASFATCHVVPPEQRACVDQCPHFSRIDCKSIRAINRAIIRRSLLRTHRIKMSFLTYRATCRKCREMWRRVHMDGAYPYVNSKR